MEKTITCLKEQVSALEQANEKIIEKNETLLSNNNKLKGKVSVLELKNKLPRVSVEKLISDELVTLHTGLPSIKHFQFLMKSIRTAAEKMKYWRGSGSNEASSTHRYQRRDQTDC